LNMFPSDFIEHTQVWTISGGGVQTGGAA
jgi:hypothetical protein